MILEILLLGFAVGVGSLRGVLWGVLAKHIKPLRMRQIFSGMQFALGAWQAITAWWR
jgi:hypothetical protein